MGGFFCGQGRRFSADHHGAILLLLPQQSSCVADASPECDSNCAHPRMPYSYRMAENTTFVPGKFKFSLQTGVGRCTLMNEPMVQDSSGRRGYSASLDQSGGLPSFHRNCAGNGQHFGDGDRAEDRKTLRHREVACFRRAVWMNLTAE